MGRRVFFPSTQRAQVTALACTLPRDSGKPFSRWSSSDLSQAAKERGIVKSISPSTIRLWLRQEKIKPWQTQSWQQPTDPRFLEKATVVLNLYEQAQSLAGRKEIVVCADEKTSIQARKLTGGVIAAKPGSVVKVGDRYERKGALNLFAGLLVHTGETIARCFERKRFVEFQTFLSMIFESLWCKRIKVIHLILDNGPTHAPKSIEAWIQKLTLPFEVKIHWLPIHASWLDQIEIVFSPLQRKVLTSSHSEDKQDLEKFIMHYFSERNKNPKPIQWSYTAPQLRKQFQHKFIPQLKKAS
ncbi:MAG: IS630 family transposase [Deltaproteobacteria bacterium]|nr:IS630 family transposase [Deltaproteobacteria bacterium]